ARGDTVLAVDHDGEALKAVNGATLTLDLTAPDAAAQIAEAAPIQRILHVAGISGTGAFETLPSAHHAKIIELNFEVPLRLTAALLAQRAMAKEAQHVFVGSLSTFTGYPGAVSYAASKDGLASFAASLNAALPKGQSAACVFPGPLATDHAARYAPDNSAKTVAARQDPYEAAGLILKALDRGQRVIIPGAKAQALAWAGRLAPNTMARLLKKALFDKMDHPRL
ncbi:MAG: SDR family NAD(P)-dependent oxidoreductase, partial [Pseudomonadota bacterium]